jgi:hypothetical protein
VVAAVEENYGDQLTVVKVDDTRREIWTEFGVRSQPAFASIDDDGTVEIHNGALRGDALTERVEALIAR